jgi:hypothetical protein
MRCEPDALEAALTDPTGFNNDTQCLKQDILQ